MLKSKKKIQFNVSTHHFSNITLGHALSSLHHVFQRLSWFKNV